MKRNTLAEKLSEEIRKSPAHITMGEICLAETILRKAKEQSPEVFKLLGITLPDETPKAFNIAKG